VRVKRSGCFSTKLLHLLNRDDIEKYFGEQDQQDIYKQKQHSLARTYVTIHGGNAKPFCKPSAELVATDDAKTHP
jgi:organic hydroperoxide reductase OsmC/OhrA